MRSITQTWKIPTFRVNAGNKNTLSMHHSRRWNVTNSVVGWKNGHMRKNVGTPEIQLGTQKRRRRNPGPTSDRMVLKGLWLSTNNMWQVFALNTEQIKLSTLYSWQLSFSAFAWNRPLKTTENVCPVMRVGLSSSSTACATQDSHEIIQVLNSKQVHKRFMSSYLIYPIVWLTIRAPL